MIYVVYLLPTCRWCIQVASGSMATTINCRHPNQSAELGKHVKWEDLRRLLVSIY